MLTLQTPVEKIVGVGPIRAKKLQGLGIFTVLDLIEWYPFRYIDLTNITPIAHIRVGQDVAIKARIASVSRARSARRWTPILEAKLEDTSGSISAVWYNQPFLAQKLRQHDEWIFYGTVALRPKKLLQSPIIEKQPRIIPVYHETAGINSRWFYKIITTILSQITPSEYIPNQVITQERLCDLADAIHWVHNPMTRKAIDQARTRLSFDELLMIMLKVMLKKTELDKLTAPSMDIDVAKLRSLVDSLPYQLTNAQRKAAWQIILDLAKTRSMNRLLQGDVGSGKTIVGALAALIAHHSGYRTVWLAPTEVLAHQHHQSLIKLLNPMNVSIGLWTGSAKENEQKDIWVGTHALLYEHAPLENIGLVIVDEQHRFGVQQRAQLRRIKTIRNETPHFLSMTATPIPRTLALTLYGDLSISVIDELPKDRQKIITQVIPPSRRDKAYDFLRSQVNKGRQIYVITPLIEDKSKNSDRLIDLERKSAINEYEHLSKEVFPNYRIGLLHGKLKSKEKQTTMNQFKNHDLDILVSTTVIEVGIDVPNATVMMIEDAERFGLAQLHQLRGRVGRGGHQSYCFLFAGAWNKAIAKRLKAMERYSSGFKLAEIDLHLRGPGELVGIRQSGFPDLKMASLTDILLIERVRKVAHQIITEGIESYPALQKKLEYASISRQLE